MKANTKAPDAAGVIHTDFIKGFIKANGGDFLFNYVSGRHELEEFKAGKTELVFIGEDINKAVKRECKEELGDEFYNNRLSGLLQYHYDCSPFKAVSEAYPEKGIKSKQALAQSAAGIRASCPARGRSRKSLSTRRRNWLISERRCCIL